MDCSSSFRTQTPSLRASVASSRPPIPVGQVAVTPSYCSPELLKPHGTFVQIRKRHPFLPVAGGGRALRCGRWNGAEFTFHLLPWPGTLVQWTAPKTLFNGPGSALLSFIPLWGCGSCRYSRSRWCSTRCRWALVTWSSTWLVFIELVLAKPSPHGKLPASHLLFGHCHQLCLLEARTFNKVLWVSVEFIGSCFLYRCLKYHCVITEFAAIQMNRLLM